MSLTHQTATEIVNLLRTNKVSVVELLDALQVRISDVDPTVNALPTLCFERAKKKAEALEKKPASERGVLCGIPVAIKDLEPVSGVRTTWGSPIFADFVPKASDCLVEMLERAGGIPYAKTNTPEFGAGANTYNEVFGRTLNPWDTSKSCAGSSGGSAVALATGMAWLASGSDLGGSLRNPASFCSVVGFRPSPGRVAAGSAGPGAYPSAMGGMPTQPFGVVGPMARNVPDLALMLDAITGVHPFDCKSIPREAGSFVSAVESALQGEKKSLKVAFSTDFGITPVDPEVAELAMQAAKRFAQIGCSVDIAHPDFSGVEDIFQTNRAMSFYVSQKNMLKHHRDKLKPEVIWNIEKAREVTMDDIERVENARGALLKRTAAFFSEYDLLLSPATIVPPFPAEQRFVEECEGVKFDNYIQWCSIAYAITVTGYPVMSVPAGFTETGLPVGLQIAAGPRQEAALLSAAARYEQVSGLSGKVPMNPISHG